jgi:ketosteroid isomerase-like protein
MVRFLIVPMLLVAVAMPAGAQTKAPRPDAMGITQELVSQVAAAVDKQDAAAWAAVLTPDATVLPAANPVTPGGIIHGRQNAEKLFAGMFNAGVKHADIKVVEAHALGRVAIWSVGEIHLTGAFPINVRYGQVTVRTRGGWKVRMMTVSGDLPPGGPPAAK